MFLKGDRCNSSKCGMVKRAFPPGQHGPKGNPRLTGYGKQLREKQKAKRIYGIMETQFLNYFNKAAKSTGNTAESFLRLLEMRLDNVVYRLGLAKNRQLARQLVSHGHITVNGKKVDIPSYNVRVSEEIAVKKSSQKGKLFSDKEAINKADSLPSWLSFDPNTLSGRVLDKPKEIESSFDIKLIIEFYSR